MQNSPSHNLDSTGLSIASGIPQSKEPGLGSLTAVGISAGCYYLVRLRRRYMDQAGRLVWEGRMSDTIKTGGANVSLVEADTEVVTLAGARPSQTVGLPHDTSGEIVVTCVVLDDGPSLDDVKIRDFLKTRLASYKVPRHVLFLNETELCLTGSAKIKTSALRELAIKRLAQSEISRRPSLPV